MNNDIESIRSAERESHIKAYSENELYADGSWLAKPVATVIKCANILKGRKDGLSLRVLDLGCGVGRNGIAVAQMLRDKNVIVESVDLLGFAIGKLAENTKKYSLEENIVGIVSSIEDYQIQLNKYDLIIVVSALEHVSSKNVFSEILKRINSGLRKGGIACFVINTDVLETEKDSGTPLIPQFEVNYNEAELNNIITEIFCDCILLEKSSNAQTYDIPRGDIISELATTVVTYVFEKQ